MQGGRHMFKKNILIIIIIVLLVIGGCANFYLLSHKVDSSPEESKDVTIEQEDVILSNTNDNTINQDHLRETFNLSLRIISAMINKDYDYLEKVIAPSVTLYKENDSISYDETAYEYPLMNDFDYANFEFRGYMEDGDETFIFFGVYNVSYEFTFVRSKSLEGNYLLKSLYTN